MPDMNGLVVIERLKADAANAPDSGGCTHLRDRKLRCQVIT